eukprot:5696251-Amphidinium_carterae.1
MCYPESEAYQDSASSSAGVGTSSTAAICRGLPLTAALQPNSLCLNIRKQGTLHVCRTQKQLLSAGVWFTGESKRVGKLQLGVALSRCLELLSLARSVLQTEIETACWLQQSSNCHDQLLPGSAPSTVMV